MPKKHVKGGSLKADQLQEVLENAYKQTDNAPNGYTMDKDLSDDRVKVYKDMNSDQVIVAHRGSKGWRDWLDNARYAYDGDITKSGTYQDARTRQKKAIDKYGAKNIISVGHSRAGKYVEELNKEDPVKEVITYNKVVHPNTIFQSNPENQTDVRTSTDIVSALSPLQFSKNKTITIPSGYDLLKAHKPSALSYLGNKLIGKGYKQMRVADMRKFIKAYKKEKYGEKMTGGASLGKRELINMMNPILEDDDLDEMVGGSIWTDFVKEFSARLNLKYACSLSKWKEPLKKAYKLKKKGEEWFAPLKETSEMGSGMEGGNKWTDFVKDVAKRDNTTYGCALSDPGTKNAYKLFKDGKPWYFPKAKEMETQTDFEEPEPVPAPANIEPIVNRIEEKVKELEKLGRENGAVAYDADSIIASIAFVNLMKKYNAKCIIANIRPKTTTGFPLGIVINSNAKLTPEYDTFKDMKERLGKALKKCIDRGVTLINIPLTLKFGKTSSGHANMLVYRPFQRIIERFEPHGKEYGNSEKDNKSINNQLKDLFEISMKPYIGEIRFRDPEDICPSNKGFQSLESSIKNLEGEGGGFCSMWSIFLTEMTMLNPLKTTKEIIDEVMDITKKEPTYLKSLIRGYVLQVEQELDTLVKKMGKSGFKMNDNSTKNNIYSLTNSLDKWLVDAIFETGKFVDAQPEFQPLPKVIKKTKSDESIQLDIYKKKLKSLSKEEIDAIYGIYGAYAPKVSKTEQISRFVGYLQDGEARGTTGLKDIDIILKQELHKKKPPFEYGMAVEGYFTDMDK